MNSILLIVVIAWLIVGTLMLIDDTKRGNVGDIPANQIGRVFYRLFIVVINPVFIAFFLMERDWYNRSRQSSKA